MIPILYESNEKQFNTLGLGALKDCIKPVVTEERNGLFYFEMKYPVTGANFEEIEPERIIVADCSNTLKNQRFVITRITKPINGIVEVYADHIAQYRTINSVLIKNITSEGTALQALKAWQDSIIDGGVFTVDSNIDTVSKINLEISKVQSARHALGGVRGSILDIYGGEFKFDNLHIRLLKSRGLDRGARIDYGNNLLEFEQDIDITETYTSICPYVILTSTGNNEYKEEILLLPEKVVHGENAKKYAMLKIKMVEFDEKSVKTEEQLRNAANAYLKANNAGVPKNKINLSSVNLSHSLNFEELENVKDEIELGDTLSLNFPKYKLYDVKMKVVTTKWNVLKEELERFVVGSMSSRFQSNVVNTLDLNTVLNDEIPSLKKEINTVRVSASGNTLVFEGEDKPTANNVGDRWIKNFPNGDKEIYYWDGAVWKPLVTKDEFIKLEQDLQKSQLAIKEAKETADKTLVEVDNIKTSTQENETSIRDLLSYKNQSEENINAIKADILEYGGKLKEIETDLSSGTIYEKINRALTTASKTEQTLAEVKKTADGAVQVTAFNSKIETIDKSINAIYKQVDPTDSSSLIYKLNETMKTVDGQVTTISNMQKSLNGIDGSLAVMRETIKEHSTTFMNLPKNITGTVTVDSKGVPQPPFKKGLMWLKSEYDFTQGYDIFNTDDNVTLDELMNAGTFVCQVDRDAGPFRWNDWKRISSDSSYQISDIYQNIDTIKMTIQNNADNSKSQFLQLSSMIDQTVTKNDLIGQINVQAGNVLIRASADGKTNVLNLTEKGTYMDTNFVKQSHIDTATITDALLKNVKFDWAVGKTLDARTINVVGLNASNIVTGKMKADFIQSGVITSTSGYWNLDSGVFINGKPTNSYISLSYGGLNMGYNYVTAMTLDHTGIRMHEGEREEIAGSFRLSSWRNSGKPTMAMVHANTHSLGFFYEDSRNETELYILLDKWNRSGKLSDPYFSIEFREPVMFTKPIYLGGTAQIEVAPGMGLAYVNNSTLGRCIFNGYLTKKNGILVNISGNAYIRKDGVLERILTEADLRSLRG